MPDHLFDRATDDVAEICKCGAAFVEGYHLDAVKLAHLAAVVHRGGCDGCGGTHEATYHHVGQFGEGPVFLVTCPGDGLATWVTTEGLA